MFSDATADSHRPVSTHPTTPAAPVHLPFQHPRFYWHFCTSLQTQNTANFSDMPVNTGRNAISRVAGCQKRVAGAKKHPFLSLKCASYVLDVPVKKLVSDGSAGTVISVKTAGSARSAGRARDADEIVLAEEPAEFKTKRGRLFRQPRHNPSAKKGLK